MTTLFTKIIQGELPSFKVYENEQHFAFLSTQPLTEGHTLVVPKKEIDTWTDLNDEEVSKLFIVSKKIALHLQGVFQVKRVAIIVAGFMVPHTHVHLIPCNSESELDFSLAKKADFGELEKIQKQIVENKTLQLIMN